METDKKTTIDMIRHGEPVGGKRYRGQIDDPLSDNGWQQMRQTVANHKPWDSIVSSTLSRCAAFAKELSHRHNIPLQLDERFKEKAWGEWEGKTPAELNEHDPFTVTRYLQDPLNNLPHGAEPITDFQKRVLDGWQQLITLHQHKHVLLVGHAGVIRVIISHVLHIPVEHMFRIQVANASVTRLDIQHLDSGLFPRLIFHCGRL
ncbi:MAG: alpha-ribazole phosphatase family protein [Gammaproteobacteria bacterium]|nr:alpha-ribazole phosphatase family protein [Gammaproteobacteria bacterium]